MPEKHLHPKELAEELGVSPKTVRSFLRSKFPRNEERLGNRWHLDEQQIEQAKDHFQR